MHIADDEQSNCLTICRKVEYVYVYTCMCMYICAYIYKRKK